MLKVQPEKSIDNRLRDEFVKVGGAMSTAAFALHCRDVGFWSVEEREAFELQRMQHIIGNALRKHDSSNLPFAGKTTERDDDGARVWKQRNLWDYETYEINIHTRLSQSDTLYTEAVSLNDECESRFGKSPMGLERAA